MSVLNDRVGIPYRTSPLVNSLKDSGWEKLIILPGHGFASRQLVGFLKENINLQTTFRGKTRGICVPSHEVRSVSNGRAVSCRQEGRTALLLMNTFVFKRVSRRIKSIYYCLRRAERFRCMRARMRENNNCPEVCFPHGRACK